MKLSLSLLAVAFLFAGCASRSDPPWTPNAQVTVSHAPFYEKAPKKDGPADAPFIYLQEGTTVQATGKSKNDYSEVILTNQMEGWVAGDLLGPVGGTSANSNGGAAYSY